MSSSMPIPKRKLPHSSSSSSTSPPSAAMIGRLSSSGSGSASLSSSSNSSSSSYYSPAPDCTLSGPGHQSSWKGKTKVPILSSATTGHTPASTTASPENWMLAPRRPSLLGRELGKSEYTVVDLGREEGMRLVSCVKRSQGWDWNQELFLPSYAANKYVDEDLQHRPDPVEEIVLTDEEAERMMPR